MYVQYVACAYAHTYNVGHAQYKPYWLQSTFFLCHIANLLAESFGDRAVGTPEEYSSECTVEGPIDCTSLSETLCVSVSGSEDKVKVSPEDLEVWEL